VTSKDFAMSDASPIRQNDIVKVTLTVGPDGALNRNQGEILSLVETADPRLPTDQQCESLQGKFAVSTIELLGVVTGASTGAGTQSTDTAGQGNYTIDEIVCTDVYDEFYLTHPLLTEANLNSPHGMRTRKGKTRMHKGIDLRAKLNTNVYAAADGTVKGLYKDFSSTGGAGNYVKIDHTDGYQTKYFHLIRQPTHIKAGDTVKAGDLIGNSGDTGNTTKPYAPHLHFELWKGSTHIDPMPFIKTIQKCGDTTPPMLAAVDPFTPSTASDEEELPSNAGEG
jgi:murein DD-endopeptidase MepM/ murein hydrolase activator NlpD